MSMSATTTLNVTIGIGCVSVAVPVYDCDGMQRSIDFPRIGGVLYGEPRYHWTAKPYLQLARAAAKNALRK